jgi:hypothetical protein
MNNEELFFENETRKHQQEVSRLLVKCAQILLERANRHDLSKLEEPERSIFIEYTPKLRGMTYGSDEYKACLEKMNVALKHHYEKNPHHPEYFSGIVSDKNDLSDSIQCMTLIDITEMLCDWIAATKRHADGDIMKSILINEKRFFIKEQLSEIFRNTYMRLESK